jgi:hypothetical protein
MSNKTIKSISECGMQPTYHFEVGKRYPLPNGKKVTDIVCASDEDNKTYHIYNEDGLLAEMINCPVIVIYDQTT